MSRANPSLVLGSKSLVMRNVDKMRGQILGYNNQYPSAEDKYKQLEDRLSAMEVQKVPGLDFGDLGLSFGVVIPHKFPRNFSNETFSKPTHT